MTLILTCDHHREVSSPPVPPPSASQAGEPIARFLDKATALRDFYDRQGAARGLANDAAVEMIWARRRLGELFTEIPRDKGKRTDKPGQCALTRFQEYIDHVSTTKQTAHKWQQEFRVDEEVLVEWMAQTQATDEQMITAEGVRKLGRKPTQPRAPPPLPKGTFNVILADPPWKYDFAETDNRKIENQYPTMKTDDIAALKPPAGTSPRTN